MRAADKFQDWVATCFSIVIVKLCPPFQVQEYAGQDNELTVAAATVLRKLPARVAHIVEVNLGCERGTQNDRLGVSALAADERVWSCGTKNFLLKGIVT